MDIFKQILTLVLTPTFILVGMVFVLRKLFEQGLNRDVERFKANLQSEFEHSKLRLENELQAKYFEFQTKFSSYHQKQIEVVGEIFAMLNEGEIIVAELIHPMRIMESSRQVELVRAADEKCVALARFFNKNRIYLDEEICQQMDNILVEMRKALVRFDVSHRNMKGTPDADMWMDAWRITQEDVPPLRKAIENQIRKNLSAFSEIPNNKSLVTKPR